MKSKFIKKAVIVCAALVTLNPVFGDEFKNSVVNIKIDKEDNDRIKINLVTSKPYDTPLFINKKQGNQYVILLPETKNCMTAQPVIDNLSGLISGLTIKTLPYVAGGTKGYTKIIISAPEPINLRAVTSLPIQAGTTVASKDTVKQPVTKIATQQTKESQLPNLSDDSVKLVIAQPKTTTKTNEKTDNIPKSNVIKNIPVETRTLKTPQKLPKLVNNMEKVEKLASTNNSDIVILPEPTILIKEQNSLKEEIKKEEKDKSSITSNANNLKNSYLRYITITKEKYDNLVSMIKLHADLVRLLLIISAIGFPLLAIFYIILLNRKIQDNISENMVLDSENIQDNSNIVLPIYDELQPLEEDAVAISEEEAIKVNTELEFADLVSNTTDAEFAEVEVTDNIEETEDITAEAEDIIEEEITPAGIEETSDNIEETEDTTTEAEDVIEEEITSDVIEETSDNIEETEDITAEAEDIIEEEITPDGIEDTTDNIEETEDTTTEAEDIIAEEITPDGIEDTTDNIEETEDITTEAEDIIEEEITPDGIEDTTDNIEETEDITAEAEDIIEEEITPDGIEDTTDNIEEIEDITAEIENTVNEEYELETITDNQIEVIADIDKSIDYDFEEFVNIDFTDENIMPEEARKESYNEYEPDGFINEFVTPDEDDDSIFDELITNPMTFEEENNSEDNVLETTEDGLVVLARNELTEISGFYLVNFENFTSLIGYINDEIFVLKTFDEFVNSEILVKVADKISDKVCRYIIKIGLYKMVVEVTESKMTHLIDL